MEHATKHEDLACGGCGRDALVLRVVDGAKLCNDCAEKSERIDRELIGVSSEDPVSCDGCGARVDYDARIAVIVRGCDGSVLCDHCASIGAEEGPS